MIRRFHSFSIRSKLIAIMMLVCGVALILSTLAYAISDKYKVKNTLSYIVASQANIVGVNSTAALAFLDQQAARDVLNGLSSQKHIIHAAIYDQYDEHFAQYRAPNSQYVFPDNIELAKAQTLAPSLMDAFYPISLDNQIIGSVYVRADLTTLQNKVGTYWGISLGVLMAVFALAWMLSARMQKVISDPIAHIAHVARNVIGKKNYSLRADKYYDDEIGELVDGLNEMLDQIQNRDEKLKQHAIDLERRVEDRTRELEKLTQEFRHLAFHDTLTGLPNRAMFVDQLGVSIRESHDNNEKLAVLFMDLDRFKAINDMLGHQVGDQLLKTVADRIQNVIRGSDVVARIGGDEFTVLLRNIVNRENACEVAKNIIESLTKTVMIGEHALHTTTSIGISLFPDDAIDATTLLKYADSAMYQVKDQGRNGINHFTDSLHERIVSRRRTEMLLHDVISGNQLEVHYQPKFSSSDHKLSGLEALLRWQHPTQGELTPAQFISVAEETGAIIEIGAWVVKEVCQQYRQWMDAGLVDVPVSINLSRRQLQDSDIVRVLVNSMLDAGIPPECIELELTESTIMDNLHDSMDRLNALKQLGIRLSVDDFGTGYSSLSILKKLPIDSLKIDREFVKNVHADEDAASIIEAIIALGHSLGLTVIAEGVEKEEEVKFLRELGCDQLQGFYFSKAIPSDQLWQHLGNL